MVLVPWSSQYSSPRGTSRQRWDKINKQTCSNNKNYINTIGWDKKNVPRDRATGLCIKCVTKGFLSRPSRLELTICAELPHWAQKSSLRKEKRKKTYQLIKLRINWLTWFRRLKTSELQCEWGSRHLCGGSTATAEGLSSPVMSGRWAEPSSRPTWSDALSALVQ